MIVINYLIAVVIQVPQIFFCHCLIKVVGIHHFYLDDRMIQYASYTILLINAKNFLQRNSDRNIGDCQHLNRLTAVRILVFQYNNPVHYHLFCRNGNICNIMKRNIWFNNIHRFSFGLARLKFFSQRVFLFLFGMQAPSNFTFNY